MVGMTEHGSELEVGETETTRISRGRVRVQYVVANPGHQ